MLTATPGPSPSSPRPFARLISDASGASTFGLERLDSRFRISSIAFIFSLNFRKFLKFSTCSGNGCSFANRSNWSLVNSHTLKIRSSSHRYGRRTGHGTSTNGGEDSTRERFISIVSMQIDRLCTKCTMVTCLPPQFIFLRNGSAARAPFRWRRPCARKGARRPAAALGPPL